MMETSATEHLLTSVTRNVRFKHQSQGSLLTDSHEPYRTVIIETRGLVLLTVMSYDVQVLMTTAS